MFKLELDLVIHFDPPMGDSGRGITLTRTVELPFPPTEEISLHSTNFARGWPPEGVPLKGIVWDVDRQVFLAKTYIVDGATPLQVIPEELRWWLVHGWRLGSYADGYPGPDQPADGILVTSDASEEDWEDDEMIFRAPRERSARCNLVFGAMIRTMAELYSNEATAYAMDQTKRYFTDRQLKEKRSPETEKWYRMQQVYLQMPFEQQTKWARRVAKKYPSLKDLVNDV